ncbi:MAG: restriction endonuclease subunit S [Candidatus Limimorpha sp.]
MKTGQEHSNEQWKKVKLGEVVVPLKGRLTEQSDCFHDDWKSLINTTAIDGESKTWANPINAVLCEPDDVLMLWDGERSGLVITGKQGVVGSTFARLRPNHELDGKYLYFFLLNNFEWIQNRRTGTGVPHAPKDLMRIFQISYPESLPAQRRIAAILTSADKVIAATQKTIAKYKQIKQGMMEDLLNEQCTMNNVQWEKVKLGECCDKITDGCHIKPKCVAKSQFLMLSSQNIKDNKLDLSDVSYLTFDDFERENHRTNIKAGDVLLTIVGTVGRTYLVKENDVNFTLQRSVAVLAPKATLDSSFLLYTLNNLQFVLENEAHGCAQKGIYLKQLNQLLISIPDLTEQRRIAAILSGIDAKIAAEEKVLEKYEKVKKGLMERLLEE